MSDPEENAGADSAAGKENEPEQLTIRIKGEVGFRCLVPRVDEPQWATCLVPNKMSRTAQADEVAQ